MRYFARLFVLLMLSCIAQTLHANLITNGSFEDDTNFISGGDETTTLGIGSTDMPGWLVVNDFLAWIGPGNPWTLTANDGDFFLDLTDFSTGAPFGGVTQDVATDIGATYQLTFDLGSSSQWGLPDSLVASAGTTSAVFTSTLTGIDEWETFNLSFVATMATTAISFVGESGSQYIGLDNVVLTQGGNGPGTPTPAPSSLTLLAIGGLVTRVLRRRKQVAASR